MPLKPALGTIPLALKPKIVELGRRALAALPEHLRPYPILRVDTVCCLGGEGASPLIDNETASVAADGAASPTLEPDAAASLAPVGGAWFINEIEMLPDLVLELHGDPNGVVARVAAAYADFARSA